MNFLDIALDCIARGWYVFPCRPRTKTPQIKGGFLSASNDDDQIRDWWAKFPMANVAIATGKSDLVVLDRDHGLTNQADFASWVAAEQLPPTYTVRTGRRVSKTGESEFGVQLYFSGSDVRSIPWLHGDIRGTTGYVMAAGSIHPDSGEEYTVLVDAPIAPVPDYVRGLKPIAKSGAVGVGGVNPAAVDDGGPITEHRNVHMISLLGKKRSEGADDDAIEEYAVEVNENRMQPPMDEDELDRIVQNACKYQVPEPLPEVTIGGKVAGRPEAPKEPVDWRSRYMTAEEYANVKPPEFLIDQFLVKKSITMLAGPVSQRKTIVAVNLAHALCTGEPLFGYFAVNAKPDRVVYLCPEMGAAQFKRRTEQIGLGEFVGKTLFIQTMSENPTALDELNDELPGAVVIVDTITRFVEGDENSSEDMRKFARKAFHLMNCGATVILLHHSKKGSSGTLDDGLRGSSELAAFVDSCWVTELEDLKDSHNTLSKMRNVKQRDFESYPFKLRPTPGTIYLSMVDEPAPEAEARSKADSAALVALKEILAVSPTMGINKLVLALKKVGHRKGGPWVRQARIKLHGGGVTVTEAA